MARERDHADHYERFQRWYDKPVTVAGRPGRIVGYQLDGPDGPEYRVVFLDGGGGWFPPRKIRRAEP